MKQEELRELVLSCLSEIAPEIDVRAVELDVELREQIDIDSMDLLNFIIAIHEGTGVDIPEADYPNFETVEGAVAYLGARVGPEPQRREPSA